MFEKYRRTNTSEMRKVDAEDTLESLQSDGVSVSQADLDAGSPRIGDMIARNPENHKDQWLVAEQYFKDNFEIAQKGTTDV